jgi:hypothetical protein
MMQEIHSRDWPTFCERVSQQRAGGMVKLEVVDANGNATEQVTSAEFQSMVFAKNDACTDVITLRLRSVREIVHEIVDPIRIELHASGGSGDFNPIRFEAESGTNLVTLHPAIHAKMLEGLRTI